MGRAEPAAPPLPPGLEAALAGALESAAPRVGLLLAAAVRRPVATAAGAVRRSGVPVVPGGTAVLFDLDHGVAGARRGRVQSDPALVAGLAEVLMGSPATPGGIAARPGAFEQGLVARRLGPAFEPLAAALAPFGVATLAVAPAADERPGAPDLVALELHVRLGDLAGTLALCLPPEVLAPRPAGGPAGAFPALGAALGRVPLSVAVRFVPIRLPASELDGLAVGDVIRLEPAGGRPLVGLVEGRPVFAARPGRRGRRLAVEIEAVEIETVEIETVEIETVEIQALEIQEVAG